MVATSPLKSFLLITLLPVIITISSALPNPNPSPIKKCTPSSPFRHTPWSKTTVTPPPSSAMHSAATSNPAPPITVDTSILTISTPLSPTESQTQILSSSPMSTTTSSPENTNSAFPNSPPRSGNGQDLPQSTESPPHSKRDSKTHQIVVIALSVSMTLLFLGFALLGFLFMYRKRHDNSHSKNDSSFEKAELNPTDCFMRRVEVDSLVSGGSSRGVGNGGGSRSTTASAQAPRDVLDGESRDGSRGGEKDSKSLGVSSGEHAKDMSGAVTKKRGRHVGTGGEKWSFDQSEETLSTVSPGEEAHGKWSFDGGEEDSISPVRKEERGGWSVYCSDSLATPTTATTACSAKTDREWNTSDGKTKWSSLETLSASISSLNPTIGTILPRSEKRDRWKAEEERRSSESGKNSQDEKTYTPTPTKIHKSNPSHILNTSTPIQLSNTTTTFPHARASLRVETAIQSPQTDDSISPLDLARSPMFTPHLQSQPHHPNHKNIPSSSYGGGEKMERASSSRPSTTQHNGAPETKRYKHFYPIDQNAQPHNHNHPQYRNQAKRRMNEVATAEMTTKTFESHIGSPPRQKDSGFWSLEDCGDNDEEEKEVVMRMGKMGKRRGGEDLWDYFITL